MNTRNIKIFKSKVDTILQKCTQQNKKFKSWDKDKSWSVFHSSHYDWWAFPIDRNSSSYGSAYKVQEKDLQILINDRKFIKMLRQNAILVCRSWGWNLQKGYNQKFVDHNQKWQRWPIRLSKMCRSLEIFQQNDLFKNAILYGVILLENYKKFTYGGQDLTPYFYQKHEQLKSDKTQNKLKHLEKENKQEKQVIKKQQILSNNKQKEQQNNQFQKQSKQINTKQKAQIIQSKDKSVEKQKLKMGKL